MQAAGELRSLSIGRTPALPACQLFVDEECQRHVLAVRSDIAAREVIRRLSAGNGAELVAQTLRRVLGVLACRRGRSGRWGSDAASAGHLLRLFGLSIKQVSLVVRSA